MNKILEKIKEVLDKTGFLVFSLVRKPDSHVLDQLFRKNEGPGRTYQRI